MSRKKFAAGGRRMGRTQKRPETRAGKIVTPGGCIVDAAPGLVAAGEARPVELPKLPSKPIALDPDAPVGRDEIVALAIAAHAPPFDEATAGKLIAASGLDADRFLGVIASHKGHGFEDLSELELRMLHARLRLVREKIEGEMTARQAKEWGFNNDLMALATYNREDYKR